jgi:hypothetical protein
MTDLAGSVPPWLRILEADRDLARRKVAASVAMIPLARAGDVNDLGLWVLLGRFVLLAGNRERNRKRSDMRSVSAASKRRIVEPPGGRITPLSYREVRISALLLGKRRLLRAKGTLRR